MFWRRLIGSAGILVYLAVPLRAETPLKVELQQARLGTDLLWTELTGTLEAPETFAVAFRSSGRISQITVEVGEALSEGEVLARLDAVQAEAALRSAQAALAAARADLVQAEQRRDRTVALLARGAGTNAEVEAAQAELIAAEASRDQAAAQLASAEQGLEDTEIRAPFSGIVTARSAEPGQVVGAAQAVLTIAPKGRREAVFYAPNAPAIDPLVGKTVEITLLDDPSTVFFAEVTEVSPLADARTGTVVVRARIDSDKAAAGTLLGAPVSSKIALELPEVVILPWSALVVQHGAPAVWVVDEASGRVSLRPVTIARYTTERLELEDGVAPGEWVVGAGAHLLYPGRVVTAGEVSQ